MRRRRAVLGVIALAVSAVGFIALPSGARAEQVEPAAVARRAYFTYPLTQVTPPLLLAGFPPSTVCLVGGLIGLPQVCSEQITRLANILGLSDGLPVIPTPDADVIQPIAPGTTPIGMASGQTRWVSLLQLAIPALPEGEQFTSFKLVMHQDGLNYALESPAFREAVLAALGQVENQDPAKLAEAVQKIADGSAPLFTQIVTGIEACPTIQPWDAGDAQNAGLDGTRLPDANCLLGTTGVYDAVARTWTFDLTFAVQAWTTGQNDGTVLPNDGIILRPIGAPNLAYGDPDLSTNFLISLATDLAAESLRPVVRYSTLPKKLPTVTAPPVVSTPNAPSVIAPAPITITTPGSSTRQVVIGPITARYESAAPAAHRPGSTSAWLLLLIPLGLLGAYLFGESLIASPVVAQRRPGALTRLMETRAETQ